jgi:hypothetical protein
VAGVKFEVRLRVSLNEPAQRAAEYSPGWSERSERNPGSRPHE